MKVPHNATARQSVKLKESSTDDDIKISTDTGEVTNIDEPQINNVNDYDDDYIDEEEAEKAKFIFGLNNATNEIIMQQDLNCNNTVKSLIIYYGGLTDWCLQFTYRCSISNEFDEDAEELENDVEFQSPDLTKWNPWAAAGWDKKDWPIPWMRTLGTILCGDGHPIFCMLRLQERDKE